MREDIFNSITTILNACTKLRGEDGTVRVYDYPITAPAGYPYCVLSSDSLTSEVLDNASDVRKYIYKIQIVGEKFGEPGAMSQSSALKAMRQTEDQILAAFDLNWDLDNSSVIRTMPINAIYGLSTESSRVVLTITLQVDVRILINL